MTVGRSQIRKERATSKKARKVQGLSQAAVCLSPLIPYLCLFFDNCNLPIAGYDYLVKLVEKACLVTTKGTWPSAIPKWMARIPRERSSQ
jgi:hypothetical protein